jgi:uncharacterized membrane protein/predicted DsbA family dithiol-disulfide isomerase
MKKNGKIINQLINLRIFITSFCILLASVGAYFSFRLARAKQGLDFELLKSCDQKAWFDCTAVNNSYFADFFGVPTGSYGFLFYTVIIGIAILLYVGPAILQRGYSFLGFILSIAGLAASLFFALISAFSVGTFCEYCFYTYLVNISLFVLFLILIKKENIQVNEMKKLLNSKLPNNIYTILKYAILPIFLLTGIIIIAEPSKSGKSELSEKEKIEQYVKRAINEYNKSPEYSFNLETAHCKGSKDAPLVIMEFADFNCSHCARMVQTLNYIEKEFGSEKVQICFKQYPLDSQCNPNATRSHKGSSCIAAGANICAGGDRFWDMLENLFMAQRFGLQNMGKIKEIAQKMGFNPGIMKDCINSAPVKKQILEDVAEGDSAQVSGTPAVFLNGKRVNYAHHPVILSAVIKHVYNKMMKSD